MRYLILTVWFSVALSFSASAEDSVEVAREGLEKAKKLYSETIEHARIDLEAAGNRELKKLRSSSKKNVDEQLKRIEKLEGELRQFSEQGTLPKDPGLTDDVDKYRETIRKAKQKCEKAFDLLAQKYISAGDDSNAKNVLEDRTRFFRQSFPSGEFQVTTNPPTGLSSITLLPDGRFKQVFDRQDIVGKWEPSDDKELLLTFDNAAIGTVRLKILDHDRMEGPNIHPNGNQWFWRVHRQSAATFSPGDFSLIIDSGKDIWKYSFHEDGTCTSESPDGKFRGSGNWRQIGSEISYELTNQGFYGGVYGGGRLRILDSDHLSGKNNQDNRVWDWKLTRRKSDHGQK